MQQTATILTPQQEMFIDFVASGKVTSDGVKLTHDEFADLIKVNRTTLYRWQKSIPSFWELVSQRAATEFISRDIPQIMKAMKIKALKGDVGAAKLLLNQVGLLKPVQKELKSVAGISIDYALTNNPLGL